jgi:hypothetical protein
VAHQPLATIVGQLIGMLAEQVEILFLRRCPALDLSRRYG